MVCHWHCQAPLDVHRWSDGVCAAGVSTLKLARAAAESASQQAQHDASTLQASVALGEAALKALGNEACQPLLAQFIRLRQMAGMGSDLGSSVLPAQLTAAQVRIDQCEQQVVEHGMQLQL